ncbi:uncharacterized protein [Clytia hemisphaerica]|uniref:uncharacterized protein n=1 Tax=Clytia hemisphaerica TaxID=252671 RepID=UPI0034D5CE09
MKIKSGLVFSRNTGQLVGFTELGQISEEIYVLERSLDGALKEKPLATHMLFIMIRGYFKHFNLPIGLYPTNSVDSEQLFTIIWEATHVTEAIGLKVHSFVRSRRSQDELLYFAFQVNGQHLSWNQIRFVYELDLNKNSLSPGLRRLPRLTNDHIRLGPRTRMRVNLAAQVLSTSMANALKKQGFSTTKELEKFIRMIDKFFDIMNVQDTYSGTSTLMG